MSDTSLSQAASPLPLSAGFEEKPVERKGLMLPPPIPSKEMKSDGAGIPGPPPRMARMPSLKQLSEHLHYTPSSTSTAQFANPLSTPGQSPSTSIPATPPSLRIATGSLPQSTPGGVSQSPLIAPSPSSRLRLPASAMMRSLSSGSNGMGTPLETVHSPNWNIRGSSGVNDLFGNPATSSPVTSIQDGLKDSPISTIMGTPQTANTNINAAGGTGPVIGRESAPPMSRSSSTNSYIQGYSNVPSLDQIRRRISISQAKPPANLVGIDSIPSTTATIATSTVPNASILSAEVVNSPAVQDMTPTTAIVKSTREVPKESAKQVDVDSPPQADSLTSSFSNESELSNVQKKKEHPLRHAWTLFFDSKTYKPEASSISQKDGGKALTDYEMTLLTVGKFDTVEGFARHLNNVRLPSLLNKNSNYHMFKNGIRPMWEDPANANGGKWVILFRNSSPTLDVAWANLTMALVGEMLDEEDEVCGIVASNRPKIDRIQIWTRTRNDHEKLNKLGRRILEVMNLEGRDRESMSMEYQYNATNSHPPSGLFLHIPFPTSRTPLSTPTPNRLSANSGPNSNVGLGIGISSSTSPRLGSGPIKSPTNLTFNTSSTGGKLEPPTLSTSLSQRRLSGGAATNAFAGPMGGMGIGMGRIGSSGGGGLGSSLNGNNISRSSSPSISPSPSPLPNRLRDNNSQLGTAGGA